jgi:NADPH-dependent ferric siderophore reductase
MTTAPNTPTRSARPARAQAILTVLEVTEVSPRLVRVRLGGSETFDNITSNESTDKYVKLLFADPAHGLVPPYDLTELREQAPEKLPSQTHVHGARDRSGREVAEHRLRHPRR